MRWDELIQARAALAGVAALLLAGGGSALAQEEPSADDAAALSGSEWQVVSTGSLASQEIVLRFEPNGLLAGRTACFDLDGTYSVDGDGLTIDAARDMLSGRECSTSEFGSADAFVGFLDAADGWTIDADGQLVITLGGEYPFDMILEPGAPTDTEDAGANRPWVGAWRLDTMVAPDGQEAELPEGTEITLDLAGDGTLTGLGGCSEYTGAYTASADGEARIADVEAAAAGSCEPVSQEVQESYLALLRVVDELAVEDGSLVLETGLLGIDIMFVPSEGAAA